MRTKQRTLWWVDAILFSGFLVAFFLDFTGVELHQWIGICAWVLIVYHLITHWDWVNGVNQRFFKGANHNVKLKFLMDSALMISAFLMTATGMVISTWLNLPINNYQAWLGVHIIVSITSLVLLVIKLAIHWKWIAKTTRTIFKPVKTPIGKPALFQPIPDHTQDMGRREFLWVMGVAGGASLVALLSATSSLASLQNEATAINPQTTSNNSLSTSNDNSTIQQFGSNYSSGGASCSIQCGRRCSYPGQCPRYTDADGDNYCDLGECA